VPLSKSGVRFLSYRGFESHPLRQIIFTDKDLLMETQAEESRYQWATDWLEADRLAKETTRRVIGQELHEIEKFDEVMVDMFGLLTYNIGPDTEPIGIEDIICQLDFKLDDNDPLPSSVFEGLALLNRDYTEWLDVDLSGGASPESERFIGGIRLIDSTLDDRHLLLDFANALSKKHSGTANPEEMELLTSEWAIALGVVERLFSQYVSEDDSSFENTGEDANRLQYLIFPVQRRFQQLLHDFDPHIDEAA
jgi:hypothetical protein